MKVQVYRKTRSRRIPALPAEHVAHTRELIDHYNKPVAEVARLLKVYRATRHRERCDAPAR